MGSATPTTKLTLIPWDPNSPDHLTRMTAQRETCGWRSEEVPEWAEKSKEGTMNLYWLIPSPTLPNHDQILTSHHIAYPAESSPLVDTSTSNFSNARTPSGEPFHPIGHIALSFPPLSELAEVSDTLTKVKTGYISKLYVSWATQSSGFGGAAVREIERLARDELGVEVVYLDTIDEKVQMRKDMMDGFYGVKGLPYPKISNEAWYVKLGYAELLRKEKGYLFAYPPDENGEVAHVWIPIVYFMKRLR